MYLVQFDFNSTKQNNSKVSVKSSLTLEEYFGLHRKIPFNFTAVVSSRASRSFETGKSFLERKQIK